MCRAVLILSVVVFGSCSARTAREPLQLPPTPAQRIAREDVSYVEFFRTSRARNQFQVSVFQSLGYPRVYYLGEVGSNSTSRLRVPALPGRNAYVIIVDNVYSRTTDSGKQAGDVGDLKRRRPNAILSVPEASLVRVEIGGISSFGDNGGVNRSLDRTDQGSLPFASEFAGAIYVHRPQPLHKDGS